jgi:hypothetical protein
MLCLRLGQCLHSRMAIIEIEPLGDDADVAPETKRAIEVLRQAKIKARRRTRSLERQGLIQVADADAERALDVLLAANIRAAVRPS